MLRAIRMTLAITLLLAAGMWAAGAVGLLAGERPPGLGPVNGALAPIDAAKPNSVSSLTTSESHRIAPIAAGTDPVATFSRLRDIVAAHAGATIVESRPYYLYAEFSTPILRFVDDVEFLLDPSARHIHVRSVSRLGHSDLGVNRARIESLRAAVASP